jgi:hypothetical protein
MAFPMSFKLKVVFGREFSLETGVAEGVALVSAKGNAGFDSVMTSV